MSRLATMDLQMICIQVSSEMLDELLGFFELFFNQREGGGEEEPLLLRTVVKNK